MIELSFTKIRDVKSPSRWHWTDSGIDFFIPNDINDLFNAENCIYTPKEYISTEEQKKLKSENFNLENWKIKIPAWYWILIPSWIKIVFTQKSESDLSWKRKVRIWEEGKLEMLFPDWKSVTWTHSSFDLVFANKSWVATKKNLLVWASVVDEAYRWEIHFHLINSSKFDVEVEVWDKIIQWIVRPVALIRPEEISVDIYENELSETTRWWWGFWSTWTK